MNIILNLFYKFYLCKFFKYNLENIIFLKINYPGCFLLFNYNLMGLFLNLFLSIFIGGPFLLIDVLLLGSRGWPLNDSLGEKIYENSIFVAFSQGLYWILPLNAVFGRLLPNSDTIFFSNFGLALTNTLIKILWYNIDRNRNTNNNNNNNNSKSTFPKTIINKFFFCKGFNSCNPLSIKDYSGIMNTIVKTRKFWRNKLQNWRNKKLQKK